MREQTTSISKNKERKIRPEWKEQGKRLKKVLEYLKNEIYPTKNISNIIDEVNQKFGSNLTSSDFSHYQSGYTLIPNYVIEILHEKYYINPDYIRGKSEWMVDVFAEKIDYIKSKGSVTPTFVTSDTKYGIERKYVRLSMYSRLYEYLITISPEKLTSPEKTILSSNERKIVGEIYIINMKKLNTTNLNTKNIY